MMKVSELKCYKEENQSKNCSYALLWTQQNAFWNYLQIHSYESYWGTNCIPIFYTLQSVWLNIDYILSLLVIFFFHLIRKAWYDTEQPEEDYYPLITNQIYFQAMLCHCFLFFLLKPQIRFRVFFAFLFLCLILVRVTMIWSL